MIKSRIFTAITGVLAVLVITACQSDKVGTIERLSPHGEPDYVADQRIGVTRSLRRVFEIGAVNTDTTNADLLRVQLRLQNRTNESQLLEYRFEWTDEKGMLVETPASRWLLEQVKPGDSVFITGVAPNPGAKDFYIKLQHKSRK